MAKGMEDPSLLGRKVERRERAVKGEEGNRKGLSSLQTLRDSLLRRVTLLSLEIYTCN